MGAYFNMQCYRARDEILKLILSWKDYELYRVQICEGLDEAKAVLLAGNELEEIEAMEKALEGMDD